MPSWFSNVFKTKPAPERTERISRAELARFVAVHEDDEEDDLEPAAFAPARRVVEAPVIQPDTPRDEPSDVLSIQAQVLNPNACVFLVDRPVFAGRSIVCSGPATAASSPLAQRIFGLSDVDVAEVVVHHMTVKVRTHPAARPDWQAFAKRVGGTIREHLGAGLPVVTTEFEAGIPSEASIRAELEDILETVINPGIAAHSGRIRLDRVEGNTVYLEMLGGCQGCAASQLTLKQGVEQMFRDAVPYVGAILDVTDHAAGRNPFYREIPA